jgi:L-asparaginase
VIPNYLEKGVGLIKLAVGMDHQLFDALVKAGYGGIVIEALGGGRVPPLWMPGIRQAIDQGVWIAITSRCPGGPVGDRYGYPGAYRDLREAGALFAQGLNGQKARIKLMAVLGAFETDAQIRGRFA